MAKSPDTNTQREDEEWMLRFSGGLLRNMLGVSFIIVALAQSVRLTVTRGAWCLPCTKGIRCFLVSIMAQTENGTSFALLPGGFKSSREKWLAVQDALSECKDHGSNGSGATVLCFSVGS